MQGLELPLPLVEAGFEARREQGLSLPALGRRDAQVFERGELAGVHVGQRGEIRLDDDGTWLGLFVPGHDWLPSGSGGRPVSIERSWENSWRSRRTSSAFSGFPARSSR